MTGGSIAYHLRPNKSIDRYAFIDLISHLERVLPIKQYKYLGLGGHSLEDFKQIHLRFGIMDMLSLESDDNAFRRQRFNKPFAFIKCQNCLSSEYLASREFIETDISPILAWLDFASPGGLRSYLEDSQVLLSKMTEGDLFRITLNANVGALGGVGAQADLSRIRRGIFRNIVGDPASAGLDDLAFTNRQYPKSLCTALRYYIEEALEGRSDYTFHPLSITTYSDGTLMLTVTGIILKKNDSINDFIEAAGLSDWPLLNIDWSAPRNINVPDFTLRERMFIDSKLPSNSPREISRWLGFYYGKDQDESIELLEMYKDFYRYSSHFTKIVI